MNNLGNVTRLEIIDHTKCDGCNGSGRIHIEGQPGTLECPACHGLGMGGREMVFFNEGKRLDAQLQDDGRTLKIFIDKREK